MDSCRNSELQNEIARYGKSIGFDEAYWEGYKCKYEQWLNRDNPYIEGTVEANGFDDGYHDAVLFCC